MAEPMEIGALSVVGYATKLSDEMLPTVVTPVFRVTDDGDRYLMPPFRIRDGRVHGACIVGSGECENLAAREEITLLDAPVEARDRHELWIDHERRARYEPAAQVADNLRKLAKGALQDAERCLSKRELERADRLASVARSADPLIVESLAIKAAIRRHKGDHAAAETMEELAKADWLPTLVGSFKALVARYRRIIPSAPSAKMRGIAVVKPASALAEAA